MKRFLRLASFKTSCCPNVFEEENFLCASKCHDVQLTYFYDARETLVERCIADYPHTLKVNNFDIFFSRDLDIELESFSF